MGNQLPSDVTHVFPDSELQSFLEMAINVAKKAGDIQLSCKSKTYSTARKNHYDIVTEVDLACEREIISEIRSRFPQHGFKSEEMDTSTDKSAEKTWQWIIDPLDGTINYAAGLPFYSVSLALQKKGVTELGVIYAAEFGDMYVSIRGHGAFGNNIPLQVSSKGDLSNSVLSFMLTSHYSNEETEKIFQLVKALSPHVRGLRLLVSQALELAYVASGRLEGHVCVKSRGFSAAAGTLLVREAGGQVTDLAGNEFGNTSRNLVASCGSLHEKILTIVGEANKLTWR